jgi:hypothetical protein
MNQDNPSPGFFVWGLDNASYGPVELPTLVTWINDDRVLADTWIFDDRAKKWQPAKEIVELSVPIKRRAKPAGETNTAVMAKAAAELKPGALRRVKILATFTEPQLERFAQFMEAQKVRQWQTVVKQGDMSDGMYLILDGEVRVRIMVASAEKILVTLGVGEFFGDVALFDRGARSADVVANVDTVLLKVSSSGFDRLCKEAPEIATPFLMAIGKTLASRLRADNKRYHDALRFIGASGG